MRPSAMLRHTPCRGVAQPGSASGLGPEGREFESRRPDQNAKPAVIDLRAFSLAARGQRRAGSARLRPPSFGRYRARSADASRSWPSRRPSCCAARQRFHGSVANDRPPPLKMFRPSGARTTPRSAPRRQRR